MRRYICLFGCAILTIGGLERASGQDWTQFRGANASGLAADSSKLPLQIGPEANVAWKVDLPSGHSSPVVVQDHIYLTAVRDKRLFTMALSKKNGKLLWEREAPVKQLEKTHAISSRAASTPAADGQVVVSFFGSLRSVLLRCRGTRASAQADGPLSQ